jgi:hypothetical protein
MDEMQFPGEGAPSPSPKPDEVLAAWGAEDLSAAPGGPRAHAIDALVAQMESVLSAGRGVVLSGEAGVGKTAAVRELAAVWREEGKAAHIIKLSSKIRLAKLREGQTLSAALDELTRVLLELPHPVVAFFEDADNIRSPEIAASIASLPLRLSNPVIMEGTPTAMGALLEEEESLEEFFVLVLVEEPGSRPPVRSSRAGPRRSGRSSRSRSPSTRSTRRSTSGIASSLVRGFRARRSIC